MDSYHVTKEDGKWKLTKTGNSRASMTSETKAEIVDGLPKFMKGKKGSVRIHKENGTIQEERTYPRSADPKSSKG
jgi:hypothetical protein